MYPRLKGLVLHAKQMAEVAEAELLRLKGNKDKKKNKGVFTRVESGMQRWGEGRVE